MLQVLQVQLVLKDIKEFKVLRIQQQMRQFFHQELLQQHVYHNKNLESLLLETLDNGKDITNTVMQMLHLLIGDGII